MGELFGQIRMEARFLAARCAILAGDSATATEDLAAAAETARRGRVGAADRTTINAGLAALDGRPRDAVVLYREALREWRDLGMVWDEALCAIDMAVLLDPADPEVAAAAESARAILVGLRARPFVERLDAAMARGSQPAEREAPTSPEPSAVPIADARP